MRGRVAGVPFVLAHRAPKIIKKFSLKWAVLGGCAQ